MVFSFVFSETEREDKQLWTYYSLQHDRSIFHNICRNDLLMPLYVALWIDFVSEMPLEFFPQIKAASLYLHCFSRISIF